jgi:hypothetical protein
MLQNRFSGPLAKGRYRQILLWAGGGLLLFLALSGAFLFGKQSRISTDDTYGNIPGFESENRRLSVGGLAAGGRNDHAARTIDLREYGSSPAPEGAISALIPVNKGTLLLNAKPVPVHVPGRVDVQVPAGTHRLEWYDSTSKRIVGETVDVPPFATRTVSFERKIDGHR